jgi:fucose 4-O-acetylase-like acetyltransferase
LKSKHSNIENSTQIGRESWIDNVKAIAIFLVVFGHHVDDKSFVKAYIYSFHMHLFFFFSGLLFRKKYLFIDYFKKRVWTLAVPYFIFSAINYVFFLLRRNWGRTPDLSINPFERLFDIFMFHEIWFLVTLFVVSILFFGIADKIRSKKSVALFSILCTSFHYILLSYFTNTVHENLIKSFTAIVFYCVGYFMQDKLNSKNIYNFVEKRPIFFICFVALYFILLYLCFNTYGLISINFHSNYLFYYFLSFSGIFFVCCVSQHIKSNVFFTFLGSNTILIYLLEGYPPVIVKRIMEILFTNDNFVYTTISYAFFYSITTIIILVPFILIINRYFPFIIGKSARQIIK